MVLTQNPLFEISDDFADLIFWALDHAENSIANGGTLVPFLIHEEQTNRGQRKLARYDADMYEASVSHARLAAALLPESVAACVLAYDGFVTFQGTKYSAVLVEGCERGKPCGVVFAQRYIPAAPIRRFHKIGNNLFLGECDSLFNQSDR